MQTPKIVIEDLPKLEHLSEEEMAEIFGAGPRGYRPMVEQLESREVMSASAMSNLGGTVAQFALQSNGHLEMTKGQVSTDLGLAQGLFQGKDAAGHLLAFELVNQQMDEFNGSAFAPVGGATTSALSEFQTLMIYGGEGHIQIGSYLQANVSVQTNASGATVVTFNSVTLNVGSFLSNVATNLQNVTKPLANLATTLQQPLLPQAWAASLTPLNLLKMYSSSDYQQADDVVNTINAINKLNAKNAATVTISKPFSIVIGGNSGPAFVTAPNLSGIAELVSPYTSGVSGLQISLADQQQFLNLLTGATANLFSYTLSFKMDPISLDQRLATIPISPETATELDLDLVGGLSVSGGATFGFDSSHLQSGNLAQGFYVQDANVTATATIGLAGTINEAYLAGYRLTGELTGGASATVTKKTYADSTGSIPVQLTADPVKLVFVQSTLGPEQLIGQYLTPAAAEAAKQALENGANNAGVAISNAFNSASARYAAELNGVGKTAGAMGVVLEGLYYSPQMQAQQAATIINNLETGATNALKSGAKTWQAGEKWLAGTPAAQTLGNIGANVQKDANASVNDIARVLKGLFNQQDKQTAQILSGLGKTATEIAGALHTVYTADDINAIAKVLEGINTGAADLANALYQIAPGTTPAGKLASTLWAIVNPAGANLGIAGGVNALIVANLLSSSADTVANFLLTEAKATSAQTLTAVESLLGGALDQYANQLLSTMTGTAQAWFNNVIAGYKNAIAAQNQIIGNAQGALNQAVTAALNTQYSAFTNAGNTLSSAQQSLNSSISAWQNWQNTNVANWTSYMDSLKSWAQSQLATVNLSLQDVGLGLWGGSAVSTFSSYAQNLVSGGEQVGAAVVQGIQQGVQAIGNLAWNGLTSSVQSFVNWVKGQVMPGLNNAEQQISSIINQATGQIQAFNNLLDDAENAYNQAINSAESACNNAINDAQYTFNTAKAQATATIQTLQQDLNAFSNQGASELASMKSQIASLASQARQNANTCLAIWINGPASQRPANMLQAAESEMGSFMQSALKYYFPQVSW